MRLTKTSAWATGILIMFLIFGINRGLFILTGETASGKISNYVNSGRKRVPKIYFEFNGYGYSFLATRFSSANIADDIPIIFNPDDPEDAYENTFGGFWLWGIIYIAIALVVWSAASLSFIGDNERLVISRKKIGLEKVSAQTY